MGLLYSDIPELVGSDTETVLENLSLLEADFEVILEKRLPHLCELAEAIIKDGGDPDIIKSIVLSIKSEGDADSGNIINENKHEADFIFSGVSVIERIFIFKQIFDHVSLDKKSLFKQLELEADSVVPLDAIDRVAYLQNSYTDTVYMEFSALLGNPRAAYFSSISDVCESVYNGNCEYCILPVETSAAGKLKSFYELIFKYGFKINAVFDLRGDKDYEYTRYALLSKRLSFKKLSGRTKARNRYLEFIVSDTDNLPVEDMLSAASYCSLKLRRIDTISTCADKDGVKNIICPVFRADGADLKTFLAFLKIDCPDFIPLGIYVQI